MKIHMKDNHAGWLLENTSILSGNIRTFFKDESWNISMKTGHFKSSCFCGTPYGPNTIKFCRIAQRQHIQV